MTGNITEPRLPRPWLKIAVAAITVAASRAAISGGSNKRLR
jgi:hypothetical protein